MAPTCSKRWADLTRRFGRGFSRQNLQYMRQFYVAFPQDRIRQIASQFYERTALSKNRVAMLAKGERARRGDTLSAEEEVRDPFVLEFLGLKDEYSEHDLEEALVRHLESFLLELGGEFAFIGR